MMLKMVVTTDNGGGPWDSNTPLRGTKVQTFMMFTTLFELLNFSFWMDMWWWG